MKKIFKKLVSVPNKFEAFLQRRKLSTLIIILAFCLFTLFNLWWYGVFDDFTDVTYRSRAVDEEKIVSYVQERVVELPYEERSEGEINYYKESYKKMASKVSTKALIEWLNTNVNWNPNFMCISSTEYYENVRNDLYSGIILEELESRHNVSRVLVEMYLDSPIFYENSRGDLISNLGESQLFEYFLARPQLRRYLPFWTTVEGIRDQKQEQKFSVVGTEKWETYLEIANAPSSRAAETQYLERAMQNYLYTDACDENGWNYDKLIEYAKQYIDLKEWGLNEEAFSAQMNKYLDWDVTE